MYGDSACIDQLEQLFQNQMVDIRLNDPPYNVTCEDKTKDALIIKNDEDSLIQHMIDVAVRYVDA